MVCAIIIFVLEAEYASVLEVEWYSAAYWVVQAGLLTPLTFARHRLSPLAAFTSGAYFLHNGRQ